MENDQISRKEFGSKLAKIGVGLLAASFMPYLGRAANEGKLISLILY